MYCVKKTNSYGIHYLKRNGWATFPKEGPLDLTDVLLFTAVERNNILVQGQLGMGEELQWYGAYK